VAKMGGTTVETGNAYRPGEDSVAENTEKAHREGQSGLLYDSVEAPEVEDLADREQMMPALKAAYGDSSWVDLDRIYADCNDVDTDPVDARRFYLNQIHKSSESAFDARRWAELAAPGTVVADGALVAAGLQGSRYATSLVACEVASGFVWVAGSWGGELTEPELNAAVRALDDRYALWRLTAGNPEEWKTLLATLEADFGKNREGTVRVSSWYGSQREKLARANRVFATAVTGGEVTHDGSAVLAGHVAFRRCRYTRTATWSPCDAPLGVERPVAPAGCRHVDDRRHVRRGPVRG
jgi:hypothetical protein